MRSLVAAGLVVAAVPAAAQVEPGAASSTGTEAWQAPVLTITRYDEHWEAFSDPEARSRRWTGTFKYVPLGDDGAYLSTGLELRARDEAFRNNQWGAAPAPNDGYLWLRAVPYVDVHVGRVRGFVQPIAAYAIGVSPRPGPVDQTRADMLQAFGDVRLGASKMGGAQEWGLTLRAGRQMLSLGTERLVGTRYGPNVPLAFDGVRGMLSLPGATVSMIAMRPVQAGLRDLDDRSSSAKRLQGIYATLPQRSLDIYVLRYRNSQAVFGTRSGEESRWSLGTRWFSNAGEWHWNVEGVVQIGSFAEQRIRAWTLATEVGRRIHAGAPVDAVVRVNVVSGDRAPGDRRLGTFNAMFPKGKYFGELSPVGPANIVSVNPRAAASLGGGLSASIAGMAYWRYSVRDGVYDVPGNLVRAAGEARARFVGKEAEATLAWQVTPELELSTSLSVFGPGGFIRQTGPARTIRMLGIESNFRF